MPSSGVTSGCHLARWSRNCALRASSAGAGIRATELHYWQIRSGTTSPSAGAVNKAREWARDQNRTDQEREELAVKRRTATSKEERHATEIKAVKRLHRDSARIASERIRELEEQVRLLGDPDGLAKIESDNVALRKRVTQLEEREKAARWRALAAEREATAARAEVAEYRRRRA